jgi:hypothetical protein
MRTHLIFGALIHVKNRYQLCKLTSKATRLLHKPNNRLQDTTNDVLIRLNHQMPWQVPFPYVITDRPIGTSESPQEAESEGRKILHYPGSGRGRCQPDAPTQDQSD